MTYTKSVYKSVLVLLLWFVVSVHTQAAESFSMVEFEKVIAREPDVKGDHIKVWTIKQDAVIRINLFEISGELPLHKHPDAQHSLMVLEGELQVQAGNQITRVRKGVTSQFLKMSLTSTST